MKILILHQAPFKKMRYDLAIDHQIHQVTYIGLDKHIADLPVSLECSKIILPSAAEQDLVNQVLEKVSSEDRFEALIALSEYGILEACHIRAKLGIEGPDYQQIEVVRDKVKMKQRIAKAGTLRYPRFIDDPRQLLQAGWRGKTISKPRDGASSQGIILHNSLALAAEHLNMKQGWDNYELEEYIEAPLYHFDGVVVAGEVQHLVVSRYLNTPLAYLAGEPVGSSQIDLNGYFQQFVRQVVAALGISRGCIHLEAFYDGDTCVFLEAANRMGGARIVETHQLRTGIHLPSVELSDYLDLNIPAPQPASEGYFGFVLYPGHLMSNNTRLVLPASILNSPHLVSVQHNDTPVEQLTYNEELLPLSLIAKADTPEKLQCFLEQCMHQAILA